MSAATTAYNTEDSIINHLESDGWKAEPGEIQEMTRAADKAASLRPNSIRFRFWRDMYRSFVISDVRDPVSGDVVLDDAKQKIMNGLADDLRDAAFICPTYGPLYSQLGQWERNFLNRPDAGARHAEMGFRLAPNNPIDCYVLATTDAELGKIPDAVAHFRRAAMLDGSMFNDAVNLLIGYFNQPEAAVDLAGEDIDHLRYVSMQLRAKGKDAGKDAALGATTGPATRPSDEALALRADALADKLLRIAADHPDASAQTLGSMGMLCVDQGDPKSAVNYLERALQFDSGNGTWRLACAQSLDKLGRRDEAVHQAQMVLDRYPNMTGAEQIIEEEIPATRAIDDAAEEAELLRKH